MSTVGRNTRIPAEVRRWAWTIALLPACAGWAAAGDMAAAVGSAGNPPDAQPEVWLCAGDRILELLPPGAEWPIVKRQLTGLKLYIGQLYGKRAETEEQTIERLRPLARFVRAHHLRVAVELGGCLDFSPLDDTAGEWSAQHELAALAHFYAAGGQVDYLDLDGPIRRLLHPENRRDGRRFDSLDRAADELVDALQLHRAAHPKTKYWLLTNFPNWGWRGDVSYHARGPQRQDYGDYDQVVRIVLEKLRAAEILLDGVTVDNPYEYLVGEHFSAKLADPKAVDWLARVRSYEDFAREQGLTFNLIVNSERGGQESDERFFRETLQMVDTYQRAGGRPSRWFVQSWYPHPQQLVPETAPHSMTALVKAVLERVRGAALERPKELGVPHEPVMVPENPSSRRGGQVPAEGMVFPKPSLELSDRAGSQQQLLGYWPLRGDCRDRSGNGLHAVNHGVRLEDGWFDGRGAYLEIPAHEKLQLGAGDFTVSAWIHTEPDLDDVLGDVISQYDPAARRGLNLYLRASAGGYNSQGDDRHVYFGIDNARLGDWEDCGRPSATSNYISNSMTVFDGSLYVGVTDAVERADWAHVFRYQGGSQWEDCGRITDLEAHGAGPMIVHRGSLFAATWNYDWTRVAAPAGKEPVYKVDPCRVYRYGGGQQWLDCGQPGKCDRLFSLASYRGSLYVVGDDMKCHVWKGGTQWQVAGEFNRYGHPMGIHDGRLFVGVHNPSHVYAYDGRQWKQLPNPSPAPPGKEWGTQTHAFDVFRGRLLVTTWELGTVEQLTADDRWETLGRLGDCQEINALAVYNGKLYGGTYPFAEAFRYDGDGNWTSLRRFLQGAGASRLTCLAVYDGKLFAGGGSGTSSHLDGPLDFRGQVYSLTAGRCASYDRDLGPGWKHLTAVRRGGRLELYVGGRLAATSAAFNPADYDLTNYRPLRIGFGEVDFFSGRIQAVRLYGRALSAGDVEHLAAHDVPNARTSGQAAAGLCPDRVD